MIIVGLLFISTLAEDACASGLVNIALGKKAVQSSTWDTNIAKLAVDGDSNSHMERYRCSHTGSNDLKPWWAVDLAAPYVVTGVKLVLRDMLGSRMDNFKIGLTNENPATTAPLSGPYELCYQHPGAVADNAVIDVKCIDGRDPARYLFVATNQEYLTICELYAYGRIGCASGYEQHEGSCYRFVTSSNGSWDSAADQCSSEGSHLVYIETSDEERYLMSTAQSVDSGLDSWWIGGRREDPPTDMTFVWKSNADTTVKNMNYQAWYSGEPNNSNNNEYCATLRMSYPGWNDLNCDVSLAFICEYVLI
jgi:hypothetical protein